MKTTLFSILIAVTAASAIPTKPALAVPNHLIKRQADTGGLTDADILNFALTLEHLEDTFYRQGLANYSSSDFASASNLGSITYNNIAQIGSDEASHVELLTGALSAAGATPVQACTYAFPATNAHDFLGLAQVLEGVGVSAYLGAARYIANPDYLEVAGSILTVEARHNAFIRLANGYSSFPSPYDAPLSPRAIVSLAGSFFASCPSGSAPTIQPFPAAAVTSSNVTKGSDLTISVNQTVLADQSTIYCAFASGVQTAFSTFNNGSCTLPTANVTGGQVYGLITSAMNISDASVLAGPFILNVDTLNNTISGGAGSNFTASNKAAIAAAGTSGAGILGVSSGIATILGVAAFALA